MFQAVELGPGCTSQSGRSECNKWTRRNNGILPEIEIPRSFLRGGCQDLWGFCSASLAYARMGDSTRSTLLCGTGDPDALVSPQCPADGCLCQDSLPLHQACFRVTELNRDPHDRGGIFLRAVPHICSDQHRADQYG